MGTTEQIKLDLNPDIPSPAAMLRDLARLYEQRNQLYSDNYKRFGHIMLMLFPNGLSLDTADDFNRFGVFVQIVSKLTRYAGNFEAGGHKDSLDDTAVYAMMQQELDMEAGPKYDIPL